jgi:hypothetical protein
MKRRNILLVSLVMILLISLLLPTAAAASNPAQDSEPQCNPVAIWLARWMEMEDDDCVLLMEYQALGVGFGVIRQAYLLSLAYDGADWEALLEMFLSEEGPGWGEVKKAYRLAVLLDLDPEELLEQRAQGLGWGEMLQEHRDGPGKPPWAGGPPKIEEDSSEEPEPSRPGHGPPPWARPAKPQKTNGRGGKP